MTFRALLHRGLQVLVTAAALGLVTAVPSLRSACAPLALTLPGLVLAGGVITAIAFRLRPMTVPSWCAAAVDSLALPVAFTLATVPVLGAWAAARTHGALIGGLLPYSDAADYLAGADRLLSDGTLDAWNSRRPLNATLLAVRLALTGGSLRGALLLQAALLGLCALLAARALATTLGRPAGAIVLGAVLVFGGIFVPTTMSECLGLSLGSLGLAVLWHAAGAPSPLRWVAGFALVTAALNARSGPFVMLPALLVWVALDRTTDGRLRVDRRGLAAGLGGTLLGFALNALVLRVHHGVRAGMQSNFAYTLYGLARGGIGWERAFTDNPVLHGMNDAEAGTYIYARAFESIRAHPADLVRGLWRNVLCMVDSVTDNASGGALAHHPVLQGAVALAAVSVLGIATTRMLRLYPDDRARRLPVAAVLGLLASVPVIYMDGRERVFAAGFPLGVAWAAVLLADTDLVPAASAHVVRLRAPLALGTTVLLAALLGVSLARHRNGPTRTTLRCGPGEVTVTVDPRVLPSLTLEAGTDTYAPTESLSDFRRGIYRDPNLGTNALADTLATLGAGTVLTASYDPRTRRMEYLVTATVSPIPVTACATPLTEGSRQVLRVGARSLER